MKAVLVRRRYWQRMHPFTLKLQSRFCRLVKTIIEYLLESLSAVGIVEVIVVVGYKAEMIKNKLGHQYGNCKITYVIIRILPPPIIFILYGWRAVWLTNDFFNCDIVYDNLLRYVVADKPIVWRQILNHNADDTLKALFEWSTGGYWKRIEMSNSWAMGTISCRKRQPIFWNRGNFFWRWK